MNKEAYRTDSLRKILILLGITAVLIVYCIFGINDKTTNTAPQTNIHKPVNTTKKKDQSDTTASKPEENTDPYSLSFSENHYIELAEIRNRA